MAPDTDPYRTLGLTRDATLDEVRRAYRRLAKANHPDAAGEAALPRFLAIQAAYDTIAGPDSGRRRPGAARPASPRRAWDPDRDRADATYRAYGGRPRRARPTGGPGASRGPSGTIVGAAADGRTGYAPAATRATAEQGDAGLDVLRRCRRRAVRARLGWSVVVRDDVGDVLDAQSQGVRRSAQARTGVPGTRPSGAARAG